MDQLASDNDDASPGPSNGGKAKKVSYHAAHLSYWQEVKLTSFVGKQSRNLNLAPPLHSQKFHELAILVGGRRSGKSRLL